MDVDFVNDFDVGSAFIGLIIEFKENPSSRTGWQVKMYHRGQEYLFDITEEAAAVKDDPQYFPYPCLGEHPFMPVFDASGVITELVNVNNTTIPGNPIKTALVMGTTRMFKKKIEENTPTFGDILDIENDVVTFKAFDHYEEIGEIAHCVYTGAMEKPHDGMSFKLASDVNVYVWDWASALAPFRRCSREEAKALKFVEHFSIGSTEDILKNCYWVSFFSTRGNEQEIDFVKCFLNKAPGWSE